MIFIEQNIKGICDKFGLDYDEFLEDLEVEHPMDLSVADLEAIAEEYEVEVQDLLFRLTFKSNLFKEKLQQIKLLVLDVDGVMTDGGMYFTENGDEIKKFNTKDGMAILHLTKSGFNVAIFSSGFKGNTVKKRAEMLGIQHCYVGRENKKEKLEAYLTEVGFDYSNVAMIGDDINDLAIMKEAGFSACPSDAVHVVKENVDVILSLKGGQGCIREFIDNYLLEKPIG